ncbi:lysophospholipid acyltransferase family protein [Rhodococcus sp. (in: high G+C Gram-positive bacteria)]|uniref:lysophospholipid acyltransferase family protein n=1 Tax=Rhodococcus sp. TaxID=1831 RepID=UPI003B8A6650
MNEVAKVIPLHADARGRSTRDRAADRPPISLETDTETDTESSPLHEAIGEAGPGTDGTDGTDGADSGLRARVAGQVAGAAGFVRRRLAGDYEVDEFGYDPHFADGVFLPALRPLFEKWFRVEVRGVENIPADGGALVVANHAGVVPIDALMTSVAVHDHHPQQRALRMLAADLAFEMPIVGNIARKAGHTLACHPDAERLLRGGEVAAVFPEGFKGIGKPFSERYKLQRFGRGGFVSAAMRAGAPIVPCSIVGSEEIYPKIGDIAPLARLLNMPYFPVTPLFPHLGPLGLVPLPSKWYIEFGTPIPTDTYDAAEADDPMVLFEVTDHVREIIQQTLYRLLAQRRNVFMG